MSKRKPSTEKVKRVLLRLPLDLSKDIDKAGAEIGLNGQTVMRLALERGLPTLRKALIEPLEEAAKS